MILATVTIVAPPGQREEVLRALRSVASPTRVEPGCSGCELYEDVEKAGAFTLMEEWVTPADFERRLRSEAYRQLLMTMELSAEPPVVRFRVVARTMGMEAVHAARGQ
jgi:quinol monooxygenase YgiN